MGKIQSLLDGNHDLEGYSSRLRFSGMLSNFAESTNIRLIGIHPDAELNTVPLLGHRVSGAGEMTPSLKKGEIWVPKSLAMGMKLTHDDQVVVVAANKQGSVNAFPFIVKGIVDTVGGPGGRDGYLNIMLIVLAWMLAVPLASAQAQNTAEEWLEIIDNTLNPQDFEAYRKLINIEPDGSGSVLRYLHEK